jgi:hypothetical protein
MPGLAGAAPARHRIGAGAVSILNAAMPDAIARGRLPPGHAFRHFIQHLFLVFAPLLAAALTLQHGPASRFPVTGAESTAGVRPTAGKIRADITQGGLPWATRP